MLRTLGPTARPETITGAQEGPLIAATQLGHFLRRNKDTA